MNLTPEQRNQFRLLKGIPITILIVMKTIGGRCKKKDLYFLGSDKTISKSFILLNDSGLITKDGVDWVLVGSGDQMILSNSPQLEEPTENSKNLSESHKVGNSPVLDPTTTVNLSNPDNLINLSSSREDKFIDSPSLPDPEIVDILKGCGVGEPSLSRLACMEHNTVDYVCKWVEVWRNYDDAKKRKPAFLIHILRSGDPLPEVQNNYDDDPDRFAKSEYAWAYCGISDDE